MRSGDCGVHSRRGRAARLVIVTARSRRPAQAEQRRRCISPGPNSRSRQPPKTAAVGWPPAPQVPQPDRVLAAAATLSTREHERPASAHHPHHHHNGSGGAPSQFHNPDGSPLTASQLLAEVRALAGRVQMRTLLLTLIEVASAMAYLHRMGARAR